MSQAFAEYLRKEEIDWDKLDVDSRVALRREFTRIGDFEESKIVESERQSVDLKQIVARHIRNDLPYKATPWWPDGGDASLAPSLESALEVVVKRSIFGIRDDKAEGFPQAPFTSINADTAMRELSEVVNSLDKGNQLSRTPQDFTLYHLGDWDMDSGVISPVEGGKRVVVNCIDLVQRGE